VVSGFRLNLFKEPKISFGDTLTVLIANPLSRDFPKKILPTILILYVFFQKHLIEQINRLKIIESSS
jgi:hypothetical protein